MMFWLLLTEFPAYQLVHTLQIKTIRIFLVGTKVHRSILFHKCLAMSVTVRFCCFNSSVDFDFLNVTVHLATCKIVEDSGIPRKASLFFFAEFLWVREVILSWPL